MKRIIIKCVPHKKQRYETIGDWYPTAKSDIVVVSDLGNPVYERACALHEEIESFLCKLHDIGIEALDEFDARFEQETKAGLHAIDDEPGDDPRAPYHDEHIFALRLERMFVEKCGGNWADYEDAMMAVWRQGEEYSGAKTPVDN